MFCYAPVCRSLCVHPRLRCSVGSVCAKWSSTRQHTDLVTIINVININVDIDIIVIITIVTITIITMKLLLLS